jgi:dimeric dUTPase (all-alpha-NTP-PPase superfamily)
VEYQVPSQNLSFQYQPIALVPRSFKYDSFNTNAANTNVKVGYGNFLHYLIDLNYNVTGKNNNTHSFNINTESIEGTHHLQKYKDWGVGYIGDYVFSNLVF